MAEWGEGDRDRIGRLRLHGRAEEPLSARLRMEGLLGALHLAPPGLPPSAILCIRHLRDPKPGALSLRRHSLQPPPAWARALQQTLQERLAHAARPALGAVPSNAEAIVFADPAELLACLASDVCSGLAPSRWWWSHLYPHAHLWARLVREWVQHPGYVPAALDTLASRGEAQAFLSRLSDSEAREILARVAARHAVPALVAALQEHAGEEEQVKGAAAGRPAPASPEGSEPAPAMSDPWEHRVPEASRIPVGLEQRTLLGVALLLRRAPTEVQHPDFPSTVARWRRAERLARAGPPRPPHPSRPVKVEGVAALPTPPPHAPRPEETRGDAWPVSPTTTDAPPRALETTRLGPKSRAATPALLRGDERHDVAPLSQDPTVMAPIRDEPPALPRSVEGDLDAPPKPLTAPSTRPAEHPAPPRLLPSPLRTSLGGLFYLLNLGLFLELYGDFSTPASPGIPLNVWDFVTLLGRRLLVEPHTDDPVWELLASLAGREPQVPPGRDFLPPDEWRVQASWLKPFREPGTWVWDLERRLRVLHPAGFLVLDIPAEFPPEDSLRRECEPYSRLAPFTLTAGPFPAGPSPTPEPSASPLERWLSWLLPYVRARLQRALGLDGDPAALARTLLEHPALVHVSPTHVDIVLSLADLPLPIRFSGLDRDIGWLPSAGRYVLFHFE
jgi:hypothetical protein